MTTCVTEVGFELTHEKDMEIQQMMEFLLKELRSDTKAWQEEIVAMREEMMAARRE